MDVFRSYRDIPPAARGAVVALGNFDGVHLGHQAVIGMARETADRMGAPLAVMVFEPHPREFFTPNGPAFRLTTLETKARLLEGLGVDLVFAFPFDGDFAAQTPQAFVMDVLVGALGVVHLVAGEDFRFGQGRAGDMALLAYMGEMEGFGVTPVAAVSAQDADNRISSSAIRMALQNGQPEQAALLLGRPWAVEGRVSTGDKRGRTIGFPTANLHLDGLIEPRLGVYAVVAELFEGPQAGRYDGVANLGRRPTFGHSDVVLETFLFDFEGDLYGKRLAVSFLAFLRPERKFDGLEALKQQIRLDTDAARAALAFLRSQKRM